MATTINTIYPPQVETFMPSFRYNESAEVWFKLSSYSEDMLNKIRFIHVSMVDQRNNENVFAGKNGSADVYPQYYPVSCYEEKNGVVKNMKDILWDSSKKMYKITIPPQVLKTSPYYNPDQYYKIQLRFDLTGSDGYPALPKDSTEYSNPTEFFYWTSNSSKAANALKLAAYTNYNQDNFSEWSTGTLIKPILISELAIQKFNTSSRININPSTDILVAGHLNFKKGSAITETTEYLSWYQIKILDNSKINIKVDTGKIYPNTENEINYYVDMSSSSLFVNTNYQMRIIYETSNGYNSYIDYPIKIVNYSSNTNNITCSKSVDEENGTITINVTGLSDLTGYLVVRRASHRTNFMKWDLLAAKDISSISSWTFIDSTLESMTGYRYQLQHITNDQTYAPIYVENQDDIIHCDFYGGLFSEKDKMLKLTFDFQVSNRSNAINRSKTDTLGGQYPIFTQNSKLKYHTYNITGRISTEDGGESFLPKQTVFGDKYYNYRYNISEPTDTSILGGSSGSLVPVKRIQSNNDWLYEREYRDAVEDWLNNGKPKLFRSMTEGNMIVMLDGITMTPDVVLGRRLYNFSATMYEIGDGKDINSIASFGLFDIVDEREK